ncbi:histidine phosphatase family protein [Fictibacillus sp. Mic-4]|uniref:histidine phosphatase family protein n=1 Tax=Fictibacillus sp. Mic-4 TaxID=3132826 RepID=UPI003CF46094
MTMIAFVRHGVTDWNKEQRAQGTLDIPLNSEGKEQALKLANRFKNEHWDKVISSDLSRARETGETIANTLHIPFSTDGRLREISYGRLEGTNHQEREAKWGANWRELDHGIEKDEEVLKRGMEFVCEVAEQYPGEKIIVVSHGAFIKKLLNVLIEQGVSDEPLHNTSVSIVTLNDKTWECKLFNCADHLNRSF